MTPEAEEMKNEFVHSIVAAIKSLPKDQYQVKILLDIEKLSIENVSNRLGITIDSVRVKKAKADHAIGVFLKNKIEQ